MGAVETRKRVLAMIDEVINAHDTEAIRRFTAALAIDGTVRSLLESFPDLHFDVVWAIAEKGTASFPSLR